MRLLSLLLVNYEYPPLGGGAGNATAYLARELARQGQRVAVLTSRFRGQPARETVEGVELLRIPVVRRRADRCTPAEMLTFIASGMLRARGLVRPLQPDISLAFMGIPSGPVAWWLRRRAGIPYMVLLRGGDVPGFLPEELSTYHRLTKPAIRALWRGAAALVANSEGLKQTADRNVPGFGVQVIPNGVDTEQFSPAEQARAGGPLRILFVGRLSRQKDLGVLLQAAARIRQHQGIELLLAGDGPEREELAKLAEALGLAAQVRFLGWTPRAELPALYRSADLFALPSRDEGMPNALLEAMASGLPVVATCIAGSEELVEEGRNGYLVPVGDAEALALRLDWLAGEPALRACFGVESRARACTRSWEQVATAYLELARTCLERKRA